MKGYEIIRIACQFSENDEIAEKLTEANLSTLDEILSAKERKRLDIYLDCLNFVQDEIACEYKPLIHEEEFKIQNFKLNISALSKPLQEVISICDLKGREVKFKIFPTYILVFANEARVRYSYKPNKATIDGDIEINLSERIYAYGVAREYYLRQGLTDEAYIYENRFKDSLKIVLRKKTKTILSRRRWL